VRPSLAHGGFELQNKNARRRVTDGPDLHHQLARLGELENSTVISRAAGDSDEALIGRSLSRWKKLDLHGRAE
jgi:hypothetical protein